MPIDYKKYHPEWKKVIRPAILLRAENKCENCNVPNHKLILRGEYNGIKVYQDDDGNIFQEDNSNPLGGDYVGEVDPHMKNNFIRVVLTIAHLDHDINNNDYSNLKAFCQKCHNNHDKDYRKANRKKNKGQLSIL